MLLVTNAELILSGEPLITLLFSISVFYGNVTLMAQGAKQDFILHFAT